MQKVFGFRKIKLIKNLKLFYLNSFLFFFIFLLINFFNAYILAIPKNTNLLQKLYSNKNLEKIIDILQIKNYILQGKYYKVFEKNYLNNTSNINIIKNILNIKENNFKILQQLLKYPQDLYSLIYPGNNYLILLQNCGETRPGGGFFGSIGILKITNTGFNIKFEDIYKLYYLNTGNKIYINNFNNNLKYIKHLNSKNYINIIDPLIYGISNLDFKNIKILFENATNQKIRGIISINSCLFEKKSIYWKYKIWEWQFINASIDLIRGKKLPNKKEFYLKNINNIFLEKKLQLIKFILNNLKFAINNNYIKVYFTNISPEFKLFLIKSNLYDIYNKKYLYWIGKNTNFNKIDRFVKKQLIIITKNNKILKLYDYGKIKIKNDIKKLIINYSLNIPTQYTNFIKYLETKYHIKLTNREKHILGLNFNFKNKGIIILPKNLKYKGKKFIIYNITLNKKKLFKTLTFNLNE